MTQPLDLVRIHFPWDVCPEFTEAGPVVALRAYGDWVATGGRNLPETTTSRARALIQMLRQRDAVLEYDPALPPVRELSDRGGFTLRPRTAEDGDLLVRENKHTTLTEEGRMIWRFQHVDP